MKIKWGALVVDGRGKLGGHVAAKNKSGNYLRTKVTPTNPSTVAQTLARILFGSISQAWSGLSESARQGWNGAVSQWAQTDIFGDLKNPSGKALFQRLNNQAQSAGYPPVLSAPAHADVAGVIVTNVFINPPSLELDFRHTGGTAGSRTMIFATPPVSAGTYFVKDQLRLIQTSVSNVMNADLGENYASYMNKFDAPEADQKIYFGFKTVQPNGQASPMQIVEVEPAP